MEARLRSVATANDIDYSTVMRSPLDVMRSNNLEYQLSFKGWERTGSVLDVYLLIQMEFHAFYPLVVLMKFETVKKQKFQKVVYANKQSEKK